MNDNAMGQLMEQAKKLQGNVQQAHEKIAAIEVVGESGGGMVKITMNGRHDVRSVRIDPTLMGDDRKIIEDLIAAAFNDGVRKVESETRNVFAGMMPPGMTFPGMR
ncbi:YbaB/EbfC family nucleoid-associated protein [Thioalkalivibrio sp. HK1]|uniref:YbaB/EbfC family nucleoid-associated protein n=1 Tax=Thioalkalivibrio sp. HK1 TaxID=1469245 RepID=UPI0004724D34|nr:YbaB/EbfC family nucleoid-associated protein [Thioalkalivibrio sp. HK1]